MVRTFGDGHRDPWLPLDEDCPVCGEPLEASPKVIEVFGKVGRKVPVRCSDPECRYRGDRPAEDVGL
jgi:hypothetical protein